MKSVTLFFLLFTFFFGCKRDKTPPISERLQKVWIASSVEEGGTVVFTKGSASNIKPGYSQFRLDLSSPTTASLTEFDANTFVGTWEVTADGKTLTLKGLSPQPTGTNGNISFTIGSVSDQELTLTRTTISLKTGGTLNSYNLTR